MNGQIIPGTCIAVDFWKIRGLKDQLIHFLTHLHGDHIVGLTSSWTRPIYCSEFTAQLLEAHYGVSKTLMNVLHVNQCTLVHIPNSSDSFCVTAFDANHCPGALMLYFEGSFGNIFFTGDFRFSIEMNVILQHLVRKIDKLYLDNTFCSEDCDFPSREICQQKIIDIAKDHPNSEIIIGIRKLGKELMLAQLGVEIDETIFVSPERYQISQCLFDCNVFAVASNEEKARIRTLPLHSITRELLFRKNQITPTIAILPTAIFTGLPCKPFCRDPNIFVVPYSDHSSFPELVEFVKLLQPHRIIPIVKCHKGPFGKDISHRFDMTLLESYVKSSRISNQSQMPQLGVLEDDSEDQNQSSLSVFNKESAISSSSQQMAVAGNSCKKYLSIKANLKPFEKILKTAPSLKRKLSIPVNRKKKIATGVIFQDDLEEPNHISENILDSCVIPQCGIVNMTMTSQSLIAGQREISAVREECPISTSASINDNSLQSVHHGSNSIGDANLSMDKYDNSKRTRCRLGKDVTKINKYSDVGELCSISKNALNNDDNVQSVDHGNKTPSGTRLSLNKDANPKRLKHCFEDEVTKSNEVSASAMNNDDSVQSVEHGNNSLTSASSHLPMDNNDNQEKLGSCLENEVTKLNKDTVLGELCANSKSSSNSVDNLQSVRHENKAPSGTNLPLDKDSNSKGLRHSLEDEVTKSNKVSAVRELCSISKGAFNSDDHLQSVHHENKAFSVAKLSLDKGADSKRLECSLDNEVIGSSSDLQSVDRENSVLDSLSFDENVIKNLIALDQGSSNSEVWVTADDNIKAPHLQMTSKPADYINCKNDLDKSGESVRDRLPSEQVKTMSCQAQTNGGSVSKDLSSPCRSNENVMNKDMLKTMIFPGYTSGRFTHIKPQDNYNKNEKQKFSLRPFFQNGNSKHLLSKFCSESDFQNALAQLM